MKFVRNLEIGQVISGRKYGKVVRGAIIKKLPGAVVIKNNKNNNIDVIDVDCIIKILKNA